MSEILQYVLTGLLTFLTTGGLGSIFYIKQSKKLKAAEVKAAELDVQAQKIENLSRTNDEWQKLYNSCLEDKRALEEKLAEGIKIVEEKNDEAQREKDMLWEKYLDCKQECSQKELYISELNWYRCEVNGCPYRRPPRKFGEMNFPKDAVNPEENPDPDVL